MTKRCFLSAASSSTSIPPLHSFDEATPPIPAVSDAPEVMFIASPVDSNARHPDGDPGIAATSLPDGVHLGFFFEDPEVVAAPGSGEPVEENSPGSDPAEPTVDVGSLSTRSGVSIATGKTKDEAKIESPYEDQRQVDSASFNEASDGAGTGVLCVDYLNSGTIDNPADDRTTIVGRRMPCAATVSKDCSTDETHGCGSGRIADIAAMMESYRGLSRSENNLPPRTNSDHTVPTHGKMRAGDIPHPLVDAKTLSVPPRHARTRGVFIIGGGAPVRIDEGIEVCLIEGIGGQINIII